MEDWLSTPVAAHVIVPALAVALRRYADNFVAWQDASLAGTAGRESRLLADQRQDLGIREHVDKYRGHRVEDRGVFYMSLSEPKSSHVGTSQGRFLDPDWTASSTSPTGIITRCDYPRGIFSTTRATLSN